MVHDSKARVQTLSSIIMGNVTGHRTSFSISSVKGDGTVFVRFRSSPYDSAAFLAQEFSRVMSARDITFTQLEDVQFRLSIDQF
jgi:hypothetical protein